MVKRHMILARLLVFGIFTILVSGIMTFGMYSTDAFADGQGKGNDEGKGNPNHGQAACENSNGKASEKNPHCKGNGIDTDGDGIPDSRDLCPDLAQVDETDHDGDGTTDADDGFPCDPTQQ